MPGPSFQHQFPPPLQTHTHNEIYTFTPSPPSTPTPKFPLSDPSARFSSSPASSPKIITPDPSKVQLRRSIQPDLDTAEMQEFDLGFGAERESMDPPADFFYSSSSDDDEEGDGEGDSGEWTDDTGNGTSQFSPLSFDQGDEGVGLGISQDGDSQSFQGLDDFRMGNEEDRERGGERGEDIQTKPKKAKQQSLSRAGPGRVKLVENASPQRSQGSLSLRSAGSSPALSPSSNASRSDLDSGTATTKTKETEMVSATRKDTAESLQAVLRTHALTMKALEAIAPSSGTESTNLVNGDIETRSMLHTHGRNRSLSAPLLPLPLRSSSFSVNRRIMIAPIGTTRSTIPNSGNNNGGEFVRTPYPFHIPLSHTHGYTRNRISRGTGVRRNHTTGGGGGGCKKGKEVLGLEKSLSDRRAVKGKVVLGLAQSRNQDRERERGLGSPFLGRRHTGRGVVASEDEDGDIYQDEEEGSVTSGSVFDEESEGLDEGSGDGKGKRKGSGDRKKVGWLDALKMTVPDPGSNGDANSRVLEVDVTVYVSVASKLGSRYKVDGFVVPASTRGTSPRSPLVAPVSNGLSPTSSSEFDDQAFGLRLRKTFAKLDGSWFGRAFSARTLSGIEIRNVGIWSGCDARQSTAPTGLLARYAGLGQNHLDEETASLTEEGLMALYRNPARGKGAFTWTNWARRLAASSSRRHSQHSLPVPCQAHSDIDVEMDNEKYLPHLRPLSSTPSTPSNDTIPTLHFSRRLSPTRILLALAFILCTTVAAALLWIFMGASGWANLRDGGRSERVGAGMAIGVLALLVQGVGVGVWVVFS